MTVVPNWLAHRAATQPTAPALLGADSAWTFTELNARVEILAGALQAAGVGAGQRVATLLGNRAEVAVLVHALVIVGAVLVPLNTRLSAPELQWQLGDCGAALLVTDARLADQALAAAVPGTHIYSIEAHSALPCLYDLPASAVAAGPIDLAATQAIIYTSGTTGRPKGVVLSYGNHWWSAMASALNLGHLPSDRWLVVLPWFHVGGLAILWRSVIGGVPALIHERFDPAAANAAITEQGVTLVSVVATMLARMFDAAAAPYPATLRAALLGGGPAPQPLLERAAGLGLPVIQTYGMTETASQAVTLAPADALRKLGSAGQPLLPLELRIMAAGVELPPNTAGEIVVRGPTVTAGYADRPDATAAAIQDGWLHTGDVGRRDDEGFLFVLDRRDDLIISGGENIYPAEVEAALLAHPAVAEAGVIAVDDAAWGQRAAAAVVLHSGAATAPAELAAFCRARLAGYKVPSVIKVVAALPRTASGKLQRAALRAQWDAL